VDGRRGAPAGSAGSDVWTTTASPISPDAGRGVHPEAGTGAGLAFHRERVAIEVAGRAWHSAGDRFQADRTKQNRLTAAGWTVLRLTWEDLTARPDEVVSTLREALRQRASGVLR